MLRVTVFYIYDKGGTAVAGHGGVSWSVVDATELPPAGKVAEGSGEVLREDHQAQPQLPPVGHHQPHSGFPHWYTAKVSKGETHFLSTLSCVFFRFLCGWQDLVSSSGHKD